MLHKEKHEEMMKRLLQRIFESRVGQYVAFKGGTLSYFFYYLDRFSTDIDLDLLDDDKEQEVIEHLGDTLLSLGNVKDEKLGKFLHRRIFRYDEKGMNIKVELNKRIWKDNTYEAIPLDGVPISCMTPDCIFANKLVALSDRFANRDLYDVYFFFTKKFPINYKIIKERTGLPINKFLQKLMKALPNHFAENTILAGLGEVLTDKQKTRVKKNLLDEVMKLLKKQSASVK